MNQALRVPRKYLLSLEPLEDRTLLSTCLVTRLSDSGGGMGFRGDLRYCINKVNAEPGPDTIQIVRTGTINITSVLPNLASEIDIEGPGADMLTVRRSTGFSSPYYRVFTVSAGAVVAISGLRISDGYLRTFSTDPPGMGGGIHNSGTLTLDECVVTKNRVDGTVMGFGGNIYNVGNLTLRDSVVSNSYLVGEFGAFGGGIYSAGTLTVINSTITGNPALNVFESSYGGGIYSSGTLTISGSTISNNTSHGDGFPSYGGGIYAAGTSTISDSIIVDNVARGEYDNGRGGGIYATGTFTLTNSTVANNAAFSGQTVGLGGGFYGRGTITNSTIVGNFASEFGGGIYVLGALGLRNTLVAANYSPKGPDLWGNLSSSGYNLIGDTRGGSGYDPTTDLLHVDPRLGPLADNGGPTLTFSLLPGSPAIDAGDNTDAPEFDQRGPGFPRIVNGTIDIGSFEVQATGALSLSNYLAWLVTADLDDGGGSGG